MTDRRAWRFGTTAPNQTDPGGFGGESSTAPVHSVASPVDNSPDGGFARDGFARELGASAMWWTAKCALLNRLRVRSTRSKSMDRTRRAITAH